MAWISSSHHNPCRELSLQLWSSTFDDSGTVSFSPTMAGRQWFVCTALNRSAEDFKWKFPCVGPSWFATMPTVLIKTDKNRIPCCFFESPAKAVSLHPEDTCNTSWVPRRDRKMVGPSPSWSTFWVFFHSQLSGNTFEKVAWTSRYSGIQREPHTYLILVPLPKQALVLWNLTTIMLS